MNKRRLYLGLLPMALLGVAFVAYLAGPPGHDNTNLHQNLLRERQQMQALRGRLDSLQDKLDHPPPPAHTHSI